MFNKTIVCPTEVREVTKEVNVTETRASTDDSIRIYSEVKEKALNSVIAYGSVDNVFKLDWYWMNSEKIGTTFIKCVFAINGMKREFDIEDRQIRAVKSKESVKQVFEVIKKNLVLKLSDILLIDLFVEQDLQSIFRN